MQNNYLNYLNNLTETINSLIKTYENNEYITKRLYYYIQEYIPTQLKLESQLHNERNIRKEKLQRQTEKFIKRFMIVHPYYYCPRNELFIHYDGNHFIPYSEDNIQYQILNTITKEKELIPWKYKIKKQMIKEIKERNPLYSIPESNTIQFIIKLLCPSIFDSKEITKYFLTIIGDRIHNKNSEHIYIMSNTFKPLIMEIENLYYNMFGIYNLLQNIKFKHYNHSYPKCRLLYIKKNKLDIDYRISKYILDIFCVASHYSHRYSSADSYLERCNNVNLIEHVYFLKNKTEENIVDTFINKEICKCKDNEINVTNILFIWKKYIDKLNIPNIIFRDTLLEYLKNKLEYNKEKEVFCNVSSMELPIVSYFTQFFNTNIIIYNNEIESYEYEIEEIITLFKSYINKNINIKLLSFDLVLDIIQYFYPNVMIRDNRILMNIYTKLWDKQDILLKFYSSINNKTFPINLQEAYQLYLMSEQKLSLYMNKDCFYIISRKIFENKLDENNFFIIDENI